MNLLVTTKFDAIYSRLFQGLLPQQIDPKGDTNKFYSDLLELDVDRTLLEQKLQRLTKEQCYGNLKPVFNSLFSSYIYWARSTQTTKAIHALQSLCILIKSILSKNPTGWEVIQILSGVDVHLKDDNIPAMNRHLAAQLALIFICGIGQMSPGAYFLRIDMYPSITHFISSLEQYTLEAALLLAILANYHRSDASELNLYFKHIKAAEDRVVMHKICRATAYTLDICVKAYQEADMEDSQSTLMSTLGSVFGRFQTHWPPSTKDSVVVPRNSNKQPIEACVSLLPVYELLSNNPIFSSVLTTKNGSGSTGLLFTSLSLSSYLLVHANSTSSPRSLAYANLSLTWLLLLSTNSQVMESLTQPATSYPVHTCRQKQPLLPNPSSDQRPVCALLDCCVLWIRHNLNKRLEVQSYIHCVWICQHVISFLVEAGIRLNYYWKELWSCILLLLEFLANKLDGLYTTGGVEKLVQETIVLLNICLSGCSSFLPSPHAIHELIYELVHGYEIIQKQAGLLRTLALSSSVSIPEPQTKAPSQLLTSMLETVGHYKTKIALVGKISATQAMQTVAREIDRDGLYGVTEAQHIVLPKRSNEIFGFARYGSADILAWLSSYER
ncbi:hypothetical protein F5878DRAFT_727952 [Lentinula raphanica]|uniref:Armadillo-like helical domain-containing protein n=1 Tax=Lentinula raphanica TaxID=153919 RepID=A0AA38P1Z4_9AGAR|nr:hypothetical protein F5878DRAFT_727952 [Lentinula raphanica]